VSTALRRTTSLVLLTAVGTAASLAVAGPASADVAEGWPPAEDVDPWHALLVLGGIPLLMGLVLVALVYLPPLIRGERIAPNAPALENQWIGGPGRGAKELAGPDTPESEAGGASARW
jgi:hypothetical protein